MELFRGNKKDAFNRIESIEIKIGKKLLKIDTHFKQLSHNFDCCRVINFPLESKFCKYLKISELISIEKTDIQIGNFEFYIRIVCKKEEKI